MALSDEGSNMVMPVSPMGGNGGFGGFGGDWGWIILLLLCGWGNGGFGGFGGGYGNMMLGYDFPWLLNGQNNINANTNAGFRDQMINDGVNRISDGISGLSTQLCNCCSDMQQTVNSGFANAETSANARQIANMQTAFAGQTAMNQGFNSLQSQLAQCCYDNRLGTADLKYTIASEACADRAAATANTQAILDKLCQLELDNYKTQVEAKNDTIAQLRADLSYARGQASQDVQTARILAGQTAEVDALYNRLNNCPVPTTPVYGRQPIFTCNNGGCGCGCSA